MFGIVAALVVVGGIRFAEKDELSASITMEMFGASCGSYRGDRQVVAKSPSGEEVGFVELTYTGASFGGCLYSGTLNIDDGSDSFILGSRSVTWPGVTFKRAHATSPSVGFTRADLADGVDLVIYIPLCPRGSPRPTSRIAGAFARIPVGRIGALGHP